MYRILIIASISVLVSCASVPKPVNRFSDSNMVAIADLQDKRSTDSLIAHFSDADSSHRLAAVRAFISVQDSLAIPALSRLLLTDTIPEIKRASAIALGQIPSAFSIPPLLQSIDQDRLPESYEALGKTARSFTNLSGLITREQVGLRTEAAWMLYRYGLRFPLDSIPRTIAESFRGKLDSSFRVAITQFLSRGIKKSDNLRPWLEELVLNDSSAEVRMNAAFALRRVKHPEVHGLLTQALQDRDYRVRVNAIRSLQAFPLNDSWTVLSGLIEDKNTTVGLVASEVIFNLISNARSNDLKDLISKSPNWRIRANLYGAYMKTEPSDSLVSAIKEVIAKSHSAYEKAALLLTLQFAEDERAFLFETILTDTLPVMRTSAATSLVEFLRRSGDHELYRATLPQIVSAFEGGDPAVIGIFAEAIADTTLSLHTAISDHSFLLRARSKLSLPRDIEALVPMEKAIALLGGKAAPNPPVNPFNNPIDWSLVKRIPFDQKVLLETTKGQIVLRLFVEEAPGTVANFVHLIERGYFKGKPFHRVVPNFVVQTGCNRGDGWGSEDYSIRSEFTERKFITGSVGMASAGKDTEGTQWFITHSPTPHLDGRYTNFAVVVSGMDVVHQLEVGDTIVFMKLL